MKRLFAFILAFTMLLSFAACDNGNEDIDNGNVDIELGDLTCLDYRIEVSPAYCSITLNRDGKLTVKAMGRYKGDDELKFTVSDRMGTIKTITVKINITE